MSKKDIEKIILKTLYFNSIVFFVKSIDYKNKTKLYVKSVVTSAKLQSTVLYRNCIEMIEMLPIFYHLEYIIIIYMALNYLFANLYINYCNKTIKFHSIPLLSYF